MEFEGKLTITKAVEMLEADFGLSITPQTLLGWCKRYKKDKLGIQLGTPKGQWWVDKENLIKFIKEGSYQKGEGKDNE